MPRLPPDGPLTLDADEHGRIPTFLRGLAIGALVGAALAGSALLERRRERRHRLEGRIEQTIEELPPPPSG